MRQILKDQKVPLRESKEDFKMYFNLENRKLIQ